MTDRLTCCGRKFSSYHGLRIHQGRMHPDSKPPKPEVFHTTSPLDVEKDGIEASVKAVSALCEAFGLADYPAMCQRLVAERDDLQARMHGANKYVTECLRDLSEAQAYFGQG